MNQKTTETTGTTGQPSVNPVDTGTGGGLYEVPIEATTARSSGTGRGPLVWAALLTLGVAIGWASVAELDQVTRGNGQIISSSKTQVIQAPDGGVIADLLVREGDVVKANQVLAYLDPAKVEAAFKETEAKRNSLRATVARLRAEVLNQPLNLPADLRQYPEIITAQTSLYQRRRSALEEELNTLSESLSITREELAMNEGLLASGDVSKTEVLRLRRQATDIQGQLTNRRNKYFQDAQAELAKAEEDLATVQEASNQRRASLQYTTLTAPVAGVVKNVRFTTRGAVLRPGDELLTIVPADEALLIEAKVRPSDIAFVKKGMDANVKLDAYDYTLYGSLEGKVVYISADTLVEETNRAATPDQQTYYRVHVLTQDRKFRNRPDEQLDLIPGMTATVELKTGKNTVLKYLLKPVVKTIDQSLSER